MLFVNQMVTDCDVDTHANLIWLWTGHDLCIEVFILHTHKINKDIFLTPFFLLCAIILCCCPCVTNIKLSKHNLVFLLVRHFSSCFKTSSFRSIYLGLNTAWSGEVDSAISNTENQGYKTQFGKRKIRKNCPAWYKSSVSKPRAKALRDAVRKKPLSYSPFMFEKTPLPLGSNYLADTPGVMGLRTIIKLLCCSTPNWRQARYKSKL